MSRLSQPLRVALVSAAVMSLISPLPAFSQSTANPPTGNAAMTSPTATQPEASPNASTSAQQRSARKANTQAARAQRKADLSKLEKNGYRPNATEADYPNNIQNAEKKANGQ
jgi:hypothetical protein